MERVGVIVSEDKSQFCIAGIKVVGYIYNFEGRYPDVFKMTKILEWPLLSDIITVRAFIGVYVYFKIWIEYFVLIAIPIYVLFKKGVEFRWEQSQIEVIV